MEHDAVRRVTQEGCSCRHQLQHSRLAFLAQVVGDATLLCHQPHQAFRLMRVQLIHHKQPHRLGVGVDRARDMRRKVGFGAGRAERGTEDLPRYHIEVGDQAQRAMPFVFKFVPLHLPRLHRLGWRDPFEGLDAGHLIAADDVPSHGLEQRRIGVHRADGLDLLGEGRRVFRFGLGVQPVAAPMGLEISLALRSAPLSGAKWR